MHRPSIPRAEARALACPAVERAAPSAPCNKTTVCDTRPFQEALNRNGSPMWSCQDRLTGAGVPAAAPSAALATGGRNVRIWATLLGPNNSGVELFGADELSRPHNSAPSCAAEISSTIRLFRTFRPNISAGRIVRVRNIEYNLWPYGPGCAALSAPGPPVVYPSDTRRLLLGLIITQKSHSQNSHPCTA